MRFLLSFQAGRVVASAFRFPGAAVSGADILILYINFGRSKSAYVIRTYRAQYYYEFIMSGTANTKERFVCDDESGTSDQGSCNADALPLPAALPFPLPPEQPVAAIAATPAVAPSPAVMN